MVGDVFMDEKKWYVVQVANNLNDDTITVEIIYKDSLLAELSKSHKNVEMTFYDVPSTPIDAKTFLLALTDAIADAETLPT
jgi:hypothetical protein